MCKAQSEAFEGVKSVLEQAFYLISLCRLIYGERQMESIQARLKQPIVQYVQ